MKKPILIALIVILSACTFTKQQKAEKLVKDYLKTHLNDPDSYQYVEFSKAEKLRDTTMIYKGKSEPVNYHGWWQINHTYRSKNGFGGIITKTDCFQIDSGFTKADCCYTFQDYSSNKIDMTKVDTGK